MLDKPKLRLLFDYKTYPLWTNEKKGYFIPCVPIYDLNGNIKEKAPFPKEIDHNHSLKSKLDFIQNHYDMAMEDKNGSFDIDADLYNGNGKWGIEGKAIFMKTLHECIEELTNLLGDKYTIENHIDFSKWE
ncbi:hypothetical protein FACS1894132_07940 [Clostridia bacterium]|nr:hypothetical protein FACS1894132_07940 [Clostridia bacterium]